MYVTFWGGPIGFQSIPTVLDRVNVEIGQQISSNTLRLIEELLIEALDKEMQSKIAASRNNT